MGSEKKQREELALRDRDGEKSGRSGTHLDSVQETFRGTFRVVELGSPNVNGLLEVRRGGEEGRGRKEEENAGASSVREERDQSCSR